MIGGLAVRPDGFVLVLDDPALLDPAEPLGTGRMFHIGLPAAHIAGGPLVDDSQWRIPASCAPHAHLQGGGCGGHRPVPPAERRRHVAADRRLDRLPGGRTLHPGQAARPTART